MAKASTPPQPQESHAERPGGKSLDHEAVIAQLERIFASSDFDASPRSRAFVRFVVEETLAGRQASLTQTTIATRVFGRRADFDATIDPIVRIQAGRLRRSLERYYLLSGGRDPIRIELPRGVYVPLIREARPGDSLRGEGERRRGAAPDGWPSVVVSTFGAMSDDPVLAGAADRFREELALEMDRYRDVRVVLRDDAPPVTRASADTSTFDLSGRFVRDAGGPRLTVRLVDRRSGGQVWAQEFQEGGLDGSGAAFGETARVVAAQVASEHGVVAQRLWVEQRNGLPDRILPYGAILLSYRFFFNRDPADFSPALDALRRAVSTHPECALAWVQLSRLHSANYAFEVAAIESSLEEALTCAQHGVQLDPTGQRAGGALAFALLLMGEVAASRAEARRALDLNPRSLVYLESLAWLLILLGDDEHAPALVRDSIARNPFHMPIAHQALWCHHLRRGEMKEAYDAALAYRDTGFFWRDLMRACCLGHLGRRDEAAASVAALLRAKPDFQERGRVLVGRLMKLPDLFEPVVDGLLRAGLSLH